MIINKKIFMWKIKIIKIKKILSLDLIELNLSNLKNIEFPCIILYNLKSLSLKISLD